MPICSAVPGETKVPGLRFRVYFVLILFVLAGATLYFIRALQGIAAILILAALWSALFAGYLFLAERKIRKGFAIFIEVATRLVQGDLTARSGITSGPPELIQVSKKLDEILSRAAAHRDQISALQENFAESERRYRSLFEESPISLWFLDLSQIKYMFERGGIPTGKTLRRSLSDDPEVARKIYLHLRIIDVNQATLQMVGAASKEEISLHLERYFGSRSTQDFVDTVLAVADGTRSWESVATRQKLSGEPIHLVMHSSVVPGHEQTYDQVIVSAVDVSARTKAEEVARRQEAELAQASRLASLGSLVSGVAHEINNPTNYIRLNGENLRELQELLTEVLFGQHPHLLRLTVNGMTFLQAWEAMEEAVSSIIEGSERIEQLVTELRDFSRKGDLDLSQAVDVNAAIGTSLRILGALLRRSTDHLSVVYDPRAPLAIGNLQQIEQSMINVITNACQSLPDRSRKLTIQTELLEPQEQVRITVIDDGVGVDEKDLPHIFEPFYTTRRSRGGTGLGLTTTHRIITAHGGTIALDSCPVSGTRVTIYLPALISPRGT